MNGTMRAIAIGTVAVGSGLFHAEAARGEDGANSSIVVLRDSAGKIAGRAFSDTIVLVAAGARGVAAPATIGPIYGDDRRTASGLATWRSAGSVLYTSPDCTSGAHVFSTPAAGLRATTQVQTPDGIVLYVGAIGPTRTVGVRSVLYDSGCSALAIRQNGLVPVDATINLTTTYPPPLSFE